MLVRNNIASPRGKNARITMSSYSHYDGAPFALCVLRRRTKGAWATTCRIRKDALYALSLDLFRNGSVEKRRNFWITPKFAIGTSDYQDAFSSMTLKVIESWPKSSEPLVYTRIKAMLLEASVGAATEFGDFDGTSIVLNALADL